MQDSEYLHGVAAKPIDYPVAVTDKAANTIAPHCSGLAAQGMVCKAIKAPFNVILIQIRSHATELRFTILADVNQIAMGCPAQDDLSHVARDARRRFLSTLRVHHDR